MNDSKTSTVNLFYNKNKNVINLGLLLALISTLCGVSFTLGKLFANDDIKELQSQVKNLEKTTKDITRIQEVGTYLSNRNNIEALQQIEQIIDEKPDESIKFLALEMKARMLVRHGGGKFDEKVREIGDLMISDFPENYNGYHWRGLADFRISMRRYANNRDNLPLNTKKLEKSLSDFDLSIKKFSTQIKDRINKVEVLIALNRYDDALEEIEDAKAIVDLKEDFHVLILDYLRILCRVLKKKSVESEKQELLSKINKLPGKVAFNYTSLELEAAFKNPSIPSEVAKELNEIMNEIKNINDPDVM